MRSSAVFLSATILSLLVAGPAGPVHAQSSGGGQQSGQDHTAHHPEGTSGASPQAASGQPPKAGGMMGSQGGQQGEMMGGDMQRMMSMMRGMMTMMSAESGMMVSHVEGRVASLKSDLKITEAQTPQWNRFADALRATAKSMNGMHGQMMQAKGMATLPARLDAQEKMLSAHLASLKALKSALDPLYASFSDDQKKQADGLMIGPMGMM